MARKPSATAKPKRRLKPKINRSDTAQSERFIEAARKAGMDETGAIFERAFEKIVPLAAERTKVPAAALILLIWSQENDLKVCYLSACYIRIIIYKWASHSGKMPSEGKMMTETQKKGSLREFRIELVGKPREDGSMFVTSPNMRPFSAVLHDGRWDDILKYLRKFLEVNFGKVKELRLIHDASELSFNDSEQSPIPPPYVIAGVSERARVSRPSKS